MLQLLAQGFVGRLGLDRFQQGLGFLGLAGDFLLHRGRLGGVGLGIPGTEALDEGVEIGPALALFAAAVLAGQLPGQGVDEEAQGRQGLGHLLAGGRVRGGVAGGEAGDDGVAAVDGMHRRVLAEHGQGAGNLLDEGRDPGQVGPVGGVAEEGVEDLLDLLQVALHFPGDLGEQQLFLGEPGHFVQLGQLATFHRRGAGHAAVQACHGDVHLVGKVAAQAGIVFLGHVGQQQGGGHFHGQGLAVAGGIVAQPGGAGLDGLGEAPVVGLGQTVHRLGEQGGLVAEHGQGRGLAGAEAAPGLLGFGDGLLGAAQGAGFRCRGGGVVQRGIVQVVQGPGGFRFGGAVAGLGEGVEHVALQPFGHGARAVDEALDLLVDAAEQAVDLAVLVQVALGQGGEEAQGAPPEATGGRRVLHGLDGPHRVAHVGGADALGHPLAANPAEQAALVAGPGSAQGGTGVRRGEGRGALGRAPRQVGEKQFGGRGGRAPGLGQGLVKGVQLEGLVRGAVEQAVQVVADGLQGLAGEGQRAPAEGLVRGFQGRQVGLAGLGEAGHPVQADDGQRPLNLVQVGAGEFDLGGVGLAGGLVQGAQGPVQGLVDFPLHPGEGADVKHLELVGHQRSARHCRGQGGAVAFSSP